MESRKKLKIDELRVDSFEVAAEKGERGTVRGAEASFFCPDASYDMSDCAECPSNTNCTDCRTAMFCDTQACTDWLDTCYGGGWTRTSPY
jgi:hypothetical protein